VPWWVWLLAGLVLCALGAIVVRRQLQYLIRATKAIATDERLPRPLRWGLTVALAIKVVPLPDFGVDEVILIVIGLLLVTIYRPTLRAILDESRA
jgi:hypothetical protein